MSDTGFYVPGGYRPQRTRMPRAIAESYTDDEPAVRNRQLAELSTQAPRVPWNVFTQRDFHWAAGQHVGLIGPTGQGKTTMLLSILPLHKYVVVFATKPRDKTMDRLISHGYLKMERWQSLDADQFPRRVLWPDATNLNSVALQERVFHHAFGAIYREGSWTVALDETWYVANTLGLSGDIKLYLLQARALDVSLVCATQRPASVPLEIYDQSSHLFFWRDNDEANLRRLSGISWRSADLVRRIISNLEEYQVLYVNTRTGKMVRTKCPEATI